METIKQRKTSVLLLKSLVKVSRLFDFSNFGQEEKSLGTAQLIFQ